MSGAIEVLEPRVVAPGGVYTCLPDGAATDRRIEDTVEAMSAGLNPFDYHSSQVCLTAQTAYSVIDDRTFALRESIAIAREMRQRRILGLFRRRYSQDQLRLAAESRFRDRVAPTIACTMAAVSYGNAMFALSFFEPNIGVEESLRLAEKQIDRVDLCQLQIYNTLLASGITDAYVERVAARAERMLGKKG